MKAVFFKYSTNTIIYFICGSLNDTVNSADYIQPNHKMINEQ